MKIRIWGFIFIILMSSNALFAGAFSVGIYGNIEGVYTEYGSTLNLPVATNADWKTDEVKSYFELKLSGIDISGFKIWSKLGVSAEFIKDNKAIGVNNWGPSFFNNGTIDSSFQNNSGENFEVRQWEADISRTFKYKKGQAYVALWRGEGRTDVGQPYLQFAYTKDDNKENKTGIVWDASGVLGFSIRGFVQDYQSDYLDETSSGNRHEYSGVLRISRDVLSQTWMNAKLGITGGALQYYKNYVLQNISSGSDITNYNQMFYNVAGLDVSLNGSIPKILNYYGFFGVGRSYAPENYLMENTPLSSVVGNSNSWQYVGDVKIDRKLDFGGGDFGQLFLGYYTRGRQDGNQLYLHDNSGDFPYQFEEKISLTYNFPVKMVTLKGNLEYYHDHDGFDPAKYHIWQVGEINDTSVTYKENLNLAMKFKGGYSFEIQWDKDYGNNYLGSFLPEGIHFLTMKVAGESKLGSLTPQVKIAALGDPNKQVVSSGIDLFLNINSWLTFYTRSAYVVSKGFWKSSDGNLTWWNSFIQFKMKTGNNSNVQLELGNGDHTSDGFVSDVDLIKNGRTFEKKVYLKFEYWVD